MAESKTNDAKASPAPSTSSPAGIKPANKKRYLVIDTGDPSRTHFAGLKLEKGISRREIPDDAWLEAEKKRLAGYWNKLGYRMSVEE